MYFSGKKGVAGPWSSNAPVHLEFYSPQPHNFFKIKICWSPWPRVRYLKSLQGVFYKKKVPRWSCEIIHEWELIIPPTCHFTPAWPTNESIITRKDHDMHHFKSFSSWFQPCKCWNDSKAKNRGQPVFGHSGPCFCFGSKEGLKSSFVTAEIGGKPVKMVCNTTFLHENWLICRSSWGWIHKVCPGPQWCFIRFEIKINQICTINFRWTLFVLQNWM